MGNFNDTLKYGETCYCNTFSKDTCNFRCSPVPRLFKNNRWHRNKSGKVLRYKHFIDMSIPDVHPISYEDESLGEISFYKKKFKRYFFNVDVMLDYNHRVSDFCTHESWKNKKKRKQWM